MRLRSCSSSSEKSPIEVPIDPTHEDVVEDGGRNRGQQPHRRGDQGLGDSGRNHGQARAAGAGDPLKCLNDADDRPEQTDEGSRASGGRQEGESPLQLLGLASRGPAEPLDHGPNLLRVQLAELLQTRPLGQPTHLVAAGQEDHGYRTALEVLSRVKGGLERLPVVEIQERLPVTLGRGQLARLVDDDAPRADGQKAQQHQDELDDETRLENQGHQVKGHDSPPRSQRRPTAQSSDCDQSTSASARCPPPAGSTRVVKRFGRSRAAYRPRRGSFPQHLRAPGASRKATESPDVTTASPRLENPKPRQSPPHVR